ncbi:MAG TPA: TonB-dependent receptor [Gemmatimonadaceae bacterium]|nr:TonB-dependent receptor [Gemmatimonadaceae bacterium]
MSCSGSRFSTFLAFVVALCAGVANAQSSRASLTGVVRTAGGNPAAGARISVTNVTGAVRGGITDAAGRYSLLDLNPGTYSVSASLVGYRRIARSGVTISGATTLDLVLEAVPLNAITVTATLREQELRDVPFSMAAPSVAQLRSQGAEQIEDIAITQAGFSVQNLGPGQSQVAMRGTSSGQTARDQPGVKEEVGVYLDEIPVSMSLFTPDLDLFDVARVEVLRGPQGTLFGAGSLAGTVRYISNQPELGVRSVFGEAGGSMMSGGSPGGSVKMGANVPLGDKAAARIAAYYNRMGGYMDAVQPGGSVKENHNTSDRSGVRAAVRVSPTARFSITPRLVYQEVNADGWNRHDSYNILANPFTTSRPKVSLGDRQLFTQIPEPFADKFTLGGLNASYDLGGVNLTSVTSYSTRDVSVVRDGGALYASIVGGSMGLPEPIYTMNAQLTDLTKTHILTQELRLGGENKGRRWLVGGFFSQGKRDYGQSVMVPGFETASGIPTTGLRAARDQLFFSDLGYELNQFALFGEGTVPVHARVNLTAGLRYYDFKEDRTQIFDGVFGNDDNGTSLVSTPGSTKANGFAPRFMAAFKATDQVTLNAQASKGFRLGGINDPLNTPICTPTDLVTFSGRDSWKDETAWNYEAGAKSTLFGGRASLNVSAYYMDISDLQLTVTAGSCTSRLVFNVPKARSSGLELELGATPTEHFDFSVNASLNNGQLRSTLTSTDTNNVVSIVSGIQSGNRLPSVPKMQASAAATYRWSARRGSVPFLSASVRHVGSRYTLIDDLRPGIDSVHLDSPAIPNAIGGPLTQNLFVFNPELPAYNLVNMRAGITRGIWEYSLFVNNLTDEEAQLGLDRERGLLARVGYLTNPPRTYGIRVSFNQ